MASSVSFMLLLIVQLQLLFMAISLFHQLSLAAARPLMTSSSDDEQFSSMKYHKGHLLTGNITLNLIWYGKFKPTQRAIISDFLLSLSSSASPIHHHPSVPTWWKATQKYYYQPINSPHSLTLKLGKQFLDESYSLSKSISISQIVQLASKGGHNNAINVVLTAPDVTVEGFCSSRCGTHGSAAAPVARNKGNKIYKYAYIWVGNSETQCPGQCAWPFHQPMYGPQSAPLVAPNGDVGMDGMVINLASLLAGTATNPFGNGYYQGPAEAPLEAASACAGIYGRGAYPGYAGELLRDESSGGSFNAYGINGRKYLLPALFNPLTSSCEALV